MYTINNFTNNDDIRIVNQLGAFTVSNTYEISV